MRTHWLLVLVPVLLAGCGKKNSLPPNVAQAGSLTAKLTTVPSPANVGLDTKFVVDLTDGGAPVDGAIVNVATFYRTMKQNGPAAACAPTGPGHYETAGMTTGMPGKWDAEITISRPNRPDARFTIPFKVVR